jgi:hypothetical protein
MNSGGSLDGGFSKQPSTEKLRDSIPQTSIYPGSFGTGWIESGYFIGDSVKSR